MLIENTTVSLAGARGGDSLFFSPCGLSLVPAYVGYLSGRAAGGEVNITQRLTTFLHGCFFVLGFSAVFIVFNIIS